MVQDQSGLPVTSTAAGVAQLALQPSQHRSGQATANDVADEHSSARSHFQTGNAVPYTGEADAAVGTHEALRADGETHAKVILKAETAADTLPRTDEADAEDEDDYDGQFFEDEAEVELQPFIWEQDPLAEHEGEDMTVLDPQRNELIRKVFTYEMLNTNPNYKRYLASMAKEPTNPPVVQRPPPKNRLQAMWWAWCDSTLRYRTFMLFSSPESSTAAMAINIIIALTIILNTITFCLETIPDWENTPLYDQLILVDYVCLAIFSVDYVVRIICCPELWPFVKSPMNIVDLLSIAPFYLELMILGPDSRQASQTRVLRLIRLLRVLRLLKLWARFQNLIVVVDALVASFDILGMLCFLLIVILIVFSTIIYYIESKEDGSPFDSIPQTMYYIQTTLTTTGYGDLYPQTYPGKAVAGVLMLFALVTLALPISVIGANFTNMWMDFKALKTAAERSAQVWPNFRELNTALENHKDVISDVMTQFRNIQSSIESEIASIRDLAQKARVLYEARAEAGQTAGWDKDLNELKRYLVDMKLRLAATRAKWDELEAVMNISSMTRADDFMLKLDRMHLGYKNLRKWFEEGTHIVKEVRLLTEDIAVLKEHLQQAPS